MPINHVINQAEAYFNGQLSPQERRLVESHLANCLTCDRYFFTMRRLRGELGPLMKQVLGNLNPPPALQHQVRHAWQKTKEPSRISIFWQISGRTVNAVSTLAVMVLLASGLVWAIKGLSLKSVADGRASQHSFVAGSPTLPMESKKEVDSAVSAPTNKVAYPTAAYNFLHESLPSLSQPLTTDSPQPTVKKTVSFQSPAEPTVQTDRQPQPNGLLAFTAFDSTTNQPSIYLLNLNDNSQQIFAIAGVSEPALRKTAENYRLAYRAWGNPTRALLSSDLMGESLNQITHFWEDAAPDWSPTENRIIFASQREVDRKWRLYSAWGDGSVEVNLRREGKSPTFAPDGFRFAFESCDGTHNHCGLWLGDLDNSEVGSKPFLEDGLANSPDWSPVGEQIAYMANPDGNWDIYEIDSNGQNGRRFTDDSAIDGLPTWSPDGQWLAFLSNRGGDWGIWLYHVSSGEARQAFDFAPNGLNLSPPNQPPYGERSWLDEQLSWSE